MDGKKGLVPSNFIEKVPGTFQLVCSLLGNFLNNKHHFSQMKISRI